MNFSFFNKNIEKDRAYVQMIQYRLRIPDYTDTQLSIKKCKQHDALPHDLYESQPANVEGCLGAIGFIDVKAPPSMNQIQI